jgi:hypothetical protein
MTIGRKLELSSQRDLESAGSEPQQNRAKRPSFRLQVTPLKTKTHSYGPIDADTMLSPLTSPQLAEPHIEDPKSKMQMIKVIAKLAIGPVTNCVFNLLV